MKKLFPLVLLSGGIAIAAIVYFGHEASTRPSDAEIILDAVAAQRDAAEELRELGKQALEVPDECREVKTGVFFELCELEPDAGEAAPDWTLLGSSAEHNCISAALHSTNARAFALQQREYLQPELSSNSVINFACDVASAAMFTDSVSGWGDATASAADLLTTFFGERAQSFVAPKIAY